LTSGLFALVELEGQGVLRKKICQPGKQNIYFRKNSKTRPQKQNEPLFMVRFLDMACEIVNALL
jgi:hypothetical protein